MRTTPTGNPPHRQSAGLTPIGNRQASANGDWYHLVPLGEYPHADSQLLQVIDVQAIQSIANRFTQEALRKEFAGLLIDQEHFSYDPEKSSEAWGWVKKVENRADGLWGQVEWTSLGTQALEDKRYKFISPVWLPRDTEPVANRAANVKRPLRLDSLGLTNSPNLRGMVPLVNRSAASPTGGHPAKPTMNRVAAHLGLTAEASEDAVLTAVTALTNRATQAEAQVKPLTNRITELEGSLKTLSEAQVEVDLAPLKNRAKPETIAVLRTALLANRTTTLPLVAELDASLPKSAGAASNGQAAAARAPITNRGASNPDERDATGSAGKSDKLTDAQARVIANRARELQAANPKRNYTEVFNQAKAEVLAGK